MFDQISGHHAQTSWHVKLTIKQPQDFQKIMTKNKLKEVWGRNNLLEMDDKFQKERERDINVKRQ